MALTKAVVHYDPFNPLLLLSDLAGKTLEYLAKTNLALLYYLRADYFY
jgi:hypothetical protein